MVLLARLGLSRATIQASVKSLTANYLQISTLRTRNIYFKACMFVAPTPQLRMKDFSFNRHYSSLSSYSDVWLLFPRMNLRIGHFHYSTDSSEKPPIGNKKPDYEITKKADEAEQQKENVPKKPEPVPIARRIQIVVGIIALWGAIYAAMKYLKNQKKIVEREEQVSQVDIGVKDYELIDHTGQKRTKADFVGQWLLLYFGFTHCPDICPEELEKMAEIIDLIDGDKNVPDILPIFISVDPERDTPEVVKNYIAEFHKKFVGLTGTKEQVKQAAKAFRVYFSAGPRDEDNDYVVDHTIVMYLMNPAGNFVDYYGSRGTPTPDIVNGIKKNMKNYARLHG